MHKKFRKILMMTSVTISLFLLSLICLSCSESNDIKYVIALFDSTESNYTVVGDKVLTVNKDDSAEFYVEIAPGYGLSYLSKGVYDAVNKKVVVEKVLYDETIILEVKKIANPIIEAENSYIEVLPTGERTELFVGEVAKIQFEANEHYNIEKLTYNEEEVTLDKVSNRKASAEIVLDDTMYLEGLVLGDKQDFSVKVFGEGSVILKPQKDIYRYGDSVEIVATPKAGHMFGNINYNADIYYEKTCRVSVIGAGPLIVTFHSQASKTINYLTNGGENITGIEPTYGESGKNVYLDNGYKKIQKVGHSLIGYNAKSDGLGESYSLGAMINMPNENINLYAMWEKWTDSSLLKVVKAEVDGVSGYEVVGFSDKGKLNIPEVLVLPEKINNVDVIKVAENAFNRVTGTKRVIIPNTVREVNSAAFANMPQLESIMLFDNLKYIDSDVFSNCNNLDRININAVSRRVYENVIESSYADKHMRLKTIEGKKIVLLSGCSLARGLDGAQFLDVEQLNGYDLIIMGVHAGYGLYHLIETVEEYINAGDIVIYAPELRVDIYGISVGWVNEYIWQYIESNYDLLNDFSLKNDNGRTNLLNNLSWYLSTRNTSIQNNDYVSGDRYTSVDKHGYFDYFRESADISGYELSEDALGLRPDLGLIGRGITEMNGFADTIMARGAKMYFSFPPVYKYKAYNDENEVLNRSMFMAKLQETLHYPILGSVEDFAYESKYFYDHVNHMATIGVPIYTSDLQAKLLIQMQKDGLL